MTQPKPAGYTDSFPTRNGDLTDQQAQVVADYMGGASTWYQDAGANFSPPDDARIPLENFGLLPKSNYRPAGATDTVPATYGELNYQQRILVAQYVSAQSLDDVDYDLIQRYDSLSQDAKDRIDEEYKDDPAFVAAFEARQYGGEPLMRSTVWYVVYDQVIKSLNDPEKQAESLPDEMLNILRWWRAIGTA